MRRLGIGIAIALVGMAMPCESVAQLLSTSFSMVQVEAGQDIYQRRCAACHLDNLTGSFEAPELAGANFCRTWNQRPVEELLNLIETTMPPGERGVAGCSGLCESRRLHSPCQRR
ncbi:MAG: hypothetical protein Ct9H300mP25_04840 [Acidobacteriota bacterium]|nr:MAG: hypothetical protein Ct9H300mP25_04840 [Acidobacteriota bacterium]